MEEENEEMDKENGEEIEEDDEEEQLPIGGVAMEEDEVDGERVNTFWAAHCVPSMTNSRRPLAWKKVICKASVLDLWQEQGEKEQDP